MINIGIIEKDFYRLQELKAFINSQQELLCTFAVTSEEELSDMPFKNSLLLVVLMGIPEATPNKTAGNKIKTVQQILPGSAIIILSEAEETDVVLDALRAGALGYLQANTPFQQIKEAIMHVLSGGAFISPVATRKITDYFRLEKQPELCGLTSREKEIMNYLIEGLSYKMMACNLNLSLDTVRFHLRNIYKKLQVKSKAEVIFKVLKQKTLI